jgi:hypothetical protein
VSKIDDIETATWKLLSDLSPQRPLTPGQRRRVIMYLGEVDGIITAADAETVHLQTSDVPTACGKHKDRRVPLFSLARTTDPGDVNCACCRLTLAYRGLLAAG